MFGKDVPKAEPITWRVEYQGTQADISNAELTKIATEHLGNKHREHFPNNHFVNTFAVHQKVITLKKFFENNAIFLNKLAEKLRQDAANGTPWKLKKLIRYIISCATEEQLTYNESAVNAYRKSKNSKQPQNNIQWYKALPKEMPHPSILTLLCITDLMTAYTGVSRSQAAAHHIVTPFISSGVETFTKNFLVSSLNLNPSQAAWLCKPLLGAGAVSGWSLFLASTLASIWAVIAMVIVRKMWNAAEGDLFNESNEINCAVFTCRAIAVITTAVNLAGIALFVMAAFTPLGLAAFVAIIVFTFAAWAVVSMPGEFNETSAKVVTCVPVAGLVACIILAFTPPGLLVGLMVLGSALVATLIALVVMKLTASSQAYRSGSFWGTSNAAAHQQQKTVKDTPPGSQHDAYVVA